MTEVSVAAPVRLVARTVRVDGAGVDLLAVAGDEGVLWEHEGAGLAGRGVALRIEARGGTAAAEEVAEVLAAIEADDEVGLPGCGPVALGALPFEADGRASLVVPEVVVGRAGDGTAWVTMIAPEGAAGRPEGAAGRPEGAAGRPEGAAGRPAVPPAGARLDAAPVAAAFRVASGRPPAAWCAAVEEARAAIRAGRLAKVVLAREVSVEADVPLSPATVAARLRQAYPTCFVFSVDGMVGASPELLVARWGDQVHSRPMAGSAARGDGPEADARLAAGLLASSKEREEHALVVTAVVDALAPVCERLHAGTGPSIVAVANVQHLATAVRGQLRAPAPTALDLAARLHPTPAVCGTPTAEARDLIRRLEGFERGRYAGPVGWVDARGDGQWAVAIRAAELDGPRARLVAGAGIVADSDPQAELAETQLKLQALLNALVRP